MTNKGKNMYKQCRINALLTQDDASYMLKISKRTLARYECDTKVPDDIVCEMAKIYDKPALVIWHIKEHTALGDWLPDIQETTSVQQLQITTILAKNELLKAERLIKEILELDKIVGLESFERYVKSALSKTIASVLYLESIKGELV